MVPHAAILICGPGPQLDFIFHDAPWPDDSHAASPSHPYSPTEERLIYIMRDGVWPESLACRGEQAQDTPELHLTWDIVAKLQNWNISVFNFSPKTFFSCRKTFSNQLFILCICFWIVLLHKSYWANNSIPVFSLYLNIYFLCPCHEHRGGRGELPSS